MQVRDRSEDRLPILQPAWILDGKAESESGQYNYFVMIVAASIKPSPCVLP
jgi:hypothetical protein